MYYKWEKVKDVYGGEHSVCDCTAQNFCYLKQVIWIFHPGADTWEAQRNETAAPYGYVQKEMATAIIASATAKLDATSGASDTVHNLGSTEND